MTQSTPDAPDDPILPELFDDPHRLASEILANHWSCASGFRLRYWQGQWWCWNGRCYFTVEESEIRARVSLAVKSAIDKASRAIARRIAESDDKDSEEKFRRKVTRSLVSDVLGAMEGLVLVPASFEQPVWLDPKKGQVPGSFLAFRNGLVDVEALLTGQPDVLRPHSALWFSPVCLAYDYDPGAACPRWLAFLGEVLEHDAERIALVGEWFAYCALVPQPSRHKFLVLVGEGANGKSVVLLVFTAFLGEANVSSVPLEMFGERFHLTATLGKLANVAAEVGDMDRLAEGALKAFTAGDLMFFDRKGRPPISARPTAKLVFSTNNLPRPADRSEGVWRRALMLPCRVAIAPDRQNLRLAEELRQELPGIFNWAVAGARRLLAQGRFTDPVVCREALDAHRLDSNPARAFLLEYFEACPGAEIECGLVYSEYTFYCEREGRRPLDASHFSHELKRIFPAVSVDRGRAVRGQDRRRAYVGLARKSEPIANLPVAILPGPRLVK